LNAARPATGANGGVLRGVFRDVDRRIGSSIGHRDGDRDRRGVASLGRSRGRVTSFEDRAAGRCVRGRQRRRASI
jgi:hypothetical protein